MNKFYNFFKNLAFLSLLFVMCNAKAFAQTTITVQPPSSPTSCPNVGISINMTATDPSAVIGYQWQLFNGATWTSLTNTYPYLGVNTNSLNISVPAGLGGTQYRCVAIGSTVAISNTATLALNPLPSITSNPSPATICVGGNTSFSITTSGGGLTYQWQYTNSGTGGWINLTDNATYSGSTTTTLSITNASLSLNSNSYRCLVTGVCSVGSASALLTVNSNLTITTNPTASTICQNNNTGFNVAVSGTAPYTYQWQYTNGTSGGWINLTDGGVYSGSTTAFLALTNVPLSYSTNVYRCIVSGGCGAPVTSANAILTVNSSTTLTSNPTNQNVCVGSTAVFLTSATGVGITYQWQENTGAGFANITNGGNYAGATSNQMSVYNVSNSMVGYTYRCIVNGTCGGPINTTTATLGTISSPVLISNPTNVTVCTGGTATYSASGSGPGVSYQWQLTNATSGGYVNLTNAGVYSGVNTPTLTITGATTALNGNSYRCLISGICTPPVATTNATITVNPNVVITSNPSSSTICNSNNTSFAVTATGVGLTYSWSVNAGTGFNNIYDGGVYSGTTTSNLGIIGATSSMNGYIYECTVSGTCGSPVVSSSATLNVNANAVVTNNPSPVTLCAGSTATFSASASGSGVTYQWQENNGSGFVNLVDGGVYSGSTTGTLTLTGVPVTMNGYYYKCIINSTCTLPLNTTQAMLSVQSLPVITSNPTSVVICTGLNTNFNATATGTAINYQWQYNDGSSGGWANLTNGGIYLGSTTPTLTLSGVTTAVSGTQYRCLVSGACTPAVTSTAASITVNPNTAITSNPISASVCAGTNTSFNVTATGTAPVTYQWQVNTGISFANLTDGGVYSGSTTSSLTLTNITASMNGYTYRCVVNGGCGVAQNSSIGTLTVNPNTTITSNPTSVTICPNASTSFTASGTGGPITYQWQLNTGSGFANLTNGGVYSGSTTGTLTLTSAPATMNGYFYRCVISGVCTVPLNTLEAQLNFSTTPAVTLNPTNVSICTGNNATYSAFGTGLGVTYQWQYNNATSGGWVNLTNASFYSGVTTTTLTVTGATVALNGTTYRCVLSGTCAPAVTTTAASITVTPNVAVTADPTSMIVCNATNANFNITATGPITSYQWQANTGSGFANITNTGVYNGTTTAFLSITGATNSMNGYLYRCVVNGTCGVPVNSNAATLTVNPNTVITSNPIPVIICPGANASFSTSATGGSITYQWQVNNGSGYVNVPASAPYSGGTTNVLSVTAATPSMDGYLYRCLINGTCTSTLTTSQATLNIYSVPAITVNPASTTICPGGNATFTASGTGAGISYQWQVNTGSGFFNVPAAIPYTGASTPTLTITNAPATYNNYKYQCVVTGTCGTATTTTATLNFFTQPAITLNPTDVTICPGLNTSYTVAATGTGVTYQWQLKSTPAGPFVSIVDNTIFSGSLTSTLNITNVTTSMNGFVVRCVVSGTCTPSVISTLAGLTVNNPPAITLNPISSHVCDGTTTTYMCTATGTNILYQWQVDRGAGFVNLTATPPFSGVSSSYLTVSAPPSSFSGYKFRCYVSGTCAPPVYTSVATLTVDTLPALVSSPVDSTICEGMYASFTATGSGTGITYQWQVNDGSGWSDIPVAVPPYYNSKSSTLLVRADHAVSSNNYQFRCKIVGACAPVIYSGFATLHVNTAPHIVSQPHYSLNVCNTGTTSFSVTATGTAITYQWQVNTGTGWNNVSGAIYTGGTTNVLAVNPVSNSMSGYWYRVVITGICSPIAISDSVQLTTTNTNSWTGAVDTKWSNKANWSCGLLPISTANVYINSLAPHMPLIDTSGAICDTLVVGKGASVAFTGTGNMLEVRGSIFNSGTFDASLGTVKFDGLGQQLVPASTYMNLTLAAPGNKILTGAITVSNTFNIATGMLIMGDHDVTMSDNGFITGGDANNYIVTNGTGVIREHNIGGTGKTGNMVFPIGTDNTSYTPVTVSNSGTPDTFLIAVWPSIYKQYDYSYNYAPFPGTINEKAVNKTWMVYELNWGGSNANMTVQWNAADELTGFVRDAAYLTPYLKSNWAMSPVFQTVGTGPFTISRNGITTMSVFGVGSPLPYNTTTPDTGRITAYPNPVTGSSMKVKFDHDPSQDVDIYITDVFGKKWYQSKINPYNYQDAIVDISVANLPKGVFILELHDIGHGGQIFTYRFVRQ